MAVVVAGRRGVVRLWQQVGRPFRKPPKTLDELKTAVVVEAAKLPNPVLVVIDDIDRLASGAAMRVLQVVRANADLPKLVYLVPFEVVSVLLLIALIGSIMIARERA